MKLMPMAMVLLVTLMLGVTGCRTADRNSMTATPSKDPATAMPVAPEANSKPDIQRLRVEQKQLQDRLEQIEQATAEHRKMMEQLNEGMTEAQQVLSGAQIEMQNLQLQAGEMDKKNTENASLIAALKNELAAHQARLQSLSVISNDAAQVISRLQASLTQEQRSREAQQMLVQQREKEIKALQESLAARDARLRQYEKEKADAAKKPTSPPAPAAGIANKPAPAHAVSATPTMPAATSAAAAQRVEDGNKQLRAGKTSEAENNFRAALAADPSLVSAQLGIAACRYTLGDYPAARKTVDAVLKTEPRNAQALGLAGLVMWHQRDLRGATRMLERALQVAPNDAQLHSYMGVVMYERGNMNAALQSLQKAVELNPKLAEAHYNLAVIFSTGDPGRRAIARQHYETALSLGNVPDPQLEEILNQ